MLSPQVYTRAAMQVKCIIIQKEIADLSAEAASLDRIARISELLDNWDNISFEERREVADGMISQIKATNEDFDIAWKILNNLPGQEFYRCAVFQSAVDSLLGLKISNCSWQPQNMQSLL